MPEGVVTIKDHAFKGLTEIDEIEFPATLQDVGASAFIGCTNLALIKFPKDSKLQTIEKHAFCKTRLFEIEGLKHTQLETIGERAFEDTGLVKVLSQIP